MLISTRFGNVAQAHLVKLPGGARTQMTFYPDRVSGARFDPKTGESFIFSKDTGGNEFFQFYRYDFADGSVTLLTDGKSRNTGAVWSNGGDRIAYGSTRRTGNDVDIYVVAVKDPKTDRRVLELTGGGWERGRLVAGRLEAPRGRRRSRSTRATCGSPTSRPGRRPC